MAALTAFRADIDEARKALDAIADKRPRGYKPRLDEDALLLSRADVDTLDDAFKAVIARVEVVRLRRSTQATLSEVASAATALSLSADGVPADQVELAALATEIARADAAVSMATPVEADDSAIPVALSRCTAVLELSDGASLDEMLRALRSMV